MELVAKHADPDKYSYSEYSIRFSCSHFSLSIFDWGKNAVVFGVGSSSLAQIVNNKKGIVGKVQHKD